MNTKCFAIANKADTFILGFVTDPLKLDVNRLQAAYNMKDTK
jgi:hypothetical protein